MYSVNNGLEFRAADAQMPPGKIPLQWNPFLCLLALVHILGWTSLEFSPCDSTLYSTNRFGYKL